MKASANTGQTVATLNRALAWELRAALMYAHYAAYLEGRDRLDFEEYYSGESTESMGHAKAVRQIIADMGGKAVTSPDATPIRHTKDAVVMLNEALKTEQTAEKLYEEVLSLFEHQSPWHHDLRHILMDEQRAQIEIKRLLK